MTTENVDIAIVGAGVSGVYSAWRLKTKYPKKKIVLFEASDRIGGRLLSVQPPDIPNMVAELGGMRVLPAVQPLIMALIDQLNERLPSGQQVELYPFPVDQPQNIAYLRGVYLRLADFTAQPDKVPYRLSFLEHGQTSGAILVNAIAQIVPGITNPNLSEGQRRMMAREGSFAGKPLWQQGFWNVLMRVISGEAYQYGVDAGGYDTTLSNWNCADAIPWFLSDFGVDPVYKGFKKGFQQVPLALAQLFEGLGGTIKKSTPLLGFDAEKAGGFTLRFDGAEVPAHSLILAMPRRSLDLIMPGSPPLQRIENLVSSVTPRPLFKLFTTYDSPWWLAAGVQSGRTLTDLPVRQTYYWPTNQGQPATAGPSMLMASYDDGPNIGFWDGLRPQRKRPRYASELAAATAAQGGDDLFDGDATNPDATWYRYKARRAMVAEVSRQLGTIHGLSYTPKARNAAFRDWGADPYGGGWNSWNIGVKSWEVRDQIVRPSSKSRLYVCGEAYSDAQGWVEGALQTADLMLDRFEA
jgi:monoamine oxidase